MEKEVFYAACDSLLGQTHEPPRKLRKRGRWGPREPGSGRYEGFGLIRYFSSNIVHLSLNQPLPVTMLTTPQGALDFLAHLVEEYLSPA